MYFLKNKVFTYFLLVLSILAGTYMMSTTPKELYPEIKVPVVVVSTIYPGASAQDVEDSVTNKLEDVLVGGLEGVDEITSSSREGVSIISIQFKDNVDLSESLLDTQDRVDEKKGELPDEALEPSIKKVNFSDQPIFTFALSSRYAYNNLINKSEEIEEILLRVPGVSGVDIDGVAEREITVLLDSEKLSQYSISPQLVVNAISRSKQTFPAGSIYINEREYKINYDSQIDTASDLENVIVSSLDSGKNIYLRDLVHSIEDGMSLYDSYSRIGSPDTDIVQQAIIFNVKKQEGGNIISLTEKIKETLETYKNERPQEEINFITIFDAGYDINTNLNDLVGSGFQTIILIIIVMGLMVGFKESIIAAIAVPLSFLLTFIGMYFAGITINFMTLFSLILVIGILIDSAIVIVEGIHDFMNEGMSFFDAAANTLKEFSKPVLAGALTTIAIFIPLMMLSGILGQFIGGIPRVIIIVLIMSLIVALVFIPAVAGILYLIDIRDPKVLLEKREIFFDKLSLWYKKLLTNIIARSQLKRRIIYILTALIFSTFILVGTGMIKSEFFTADDIDKSYINIELEQGSSLEKTSEAVKQVEEIISKQKYVTAFTTTIGSENVFVGERRTGSHYGNIIVNLESMEVGNQANSNIREALSVIDDFSVQVLIPESGPPVGAPFQVKIMGSEWNDINTAAESIALYVESLPGTRDVKSGVDVGLTEIKLKVIHDRLSEYGLTAFDVSSLLRTTIYGTTATSLNIGDEGDIDVNVKVALNTDAKSHQESNHVNFDQIKNIPIQTIKGEVLLSYFVTEELQQATSIATHINGQKNKTVTSYVKDGFLPIDIVNAFNKNSNEIELPEGVSFELAGSSDEGNEAGQELIVSLAFGLLLIFGVLIWQFGSLRDVLFILSVVPLGLIGVLYGLFFSGLTLSFTAMLGFIALVGVMVNNSIILIDVMNKIRLREPQLTKREVVVKGAAMRLRPIILTTLTTVLGMIPLLFVSPMWTAFAFTMISGLSFATVLTLIVIPMFYEKWSN